LINCRAPVSNEANAWLLNFGRGALIDDADLIAAAGAKRIAGASWMYSGRSRCRQHIRSGRLKASSCCRISAAVTQSVTRSVARLFVDNLGRFLDGKPLRETVDRAAGY